MRSKINRTLLLLSIFVFAEAAGQGDEQALEALLARARALELDTPYVAPPGDPLEHHAAGFAKIMCSAVFITGLDADFASDNVGYFVAPYAVRSDFDPPVIDHAARAVHVTVPGGVTRTAKQVGDQGCVALPPGAEEVSFTPQSIERRLPDPSAQLWPMEDLAPQDPLPDEIDRDKLQQAIAAAFEPPDAMTAAFVVTWRGRLIGERYGEGVSSQTPLASWSMGKSLTAALMGALIQQGAYELEQPAPIPEWQGADDPRGQIRIVDLLQMSSGLRSRAPGDPDYDPAGPYPDHVYLYTGPGDSFRYAAEKPLQWPPGTVGRYRNTDPVLINYLIRLAVEGRDEDYFSFPQRALFDKIGIRTMTIETDAYGNFLGQGYVLGSARDWARLGNLFLQDGVWNGERILPAGYAEFVSTVAPAWAADNRPTYGGFFWLSGDIFAMVGAGGQYTFIVPSHDLVVVRMGHDRGEPAVGMTGLDPAAMLRSGQPGPLLSLLMEAVRESRPLVP